ncbi:MAG: glycosyl hydrolase [Chitinophagaceae bacterium]
MKRVLITYSWLFGLLLTGSQLLAQPSADLEAQFRNPPASAKPWVFWYWMHGAVSRQGITADLEAMKEVGIGGAYLMPIKDTVAGLYPSPARQLTDEWWQMVQFAMSEAKRLGLQLGMHVSDGFALAGGPWITPELSMQKLTWTKTYLKGGDLVDTRLEKPEAIAGYYKDIAVLAYPANSRQAFSDTVLVPTVTASTGAPAAFLAFAGDGKESFKSDTACWIQYKYAVPFTCRSVRVHVGGNNYQAQRLIVQAGNDGVNFTTITRLQPPRHGWQDTDEDVTHAIPATTAKYFRFVYDKDGSEPGSEDLDAAKWKPSLKVMGIYLSDEPVIHQYESKNGSIWRVSTPTTNGQVPASVAVPLSAVVDLSAKMDSSGALRWTAPPGNWIIVRIGHTSTGHTNATAGAGKGLECDKFNPVAIRLQFENWFAQAFRKTDAATVREVLKVFHVDSWECGSQNWSPVFREEFRKRRGYDLMPYLLAMTGLPLQDAATSEKFLRDIRQTIAELVSDVFYVTLNGLAQEKGCSFSAESVAPTMISDGLLHYQHVDIPMGEFWLNSPTHDKPNDMLDAISGAHVYGKNIVAAEAFTSVRMNWGEHPGLLKPIGDRNFALGINKLALHVFTHNPWMDRKPGMTLDGVGLYFQRDQTWFRQSKAWISYLARCQALLQVGQPVTDIAVFTGEELPRRSILPDRLVGTLPGLFGNRKVTDEQKRLANTGQPLRSIPDGVTHSANMADPQDWIDPLNGYAYDSFNPDVLLRASVKNGKVILPGGASYKVLVFPAKHPMLPDTTMMSVAVAKKLVQLIRDGATVVLPRHYSTAVHLQEKDDDILAMMKDLLTIKGKKGRVLFTPYTASSFAHSGLAKDVEIENQTHTIAWTHRRSDKEDIYFIANQKDSMQVVHLSFRIVGKEPELWDAVTGTVQKAVNWSIQKNRTYLTLPLDANASVFVIFRQPALFSRPPSFLAHKKETSVLTGTWQVAFDEKTGGPPRPVRFDSLTSWTDHPDARIKYYSGTAVYSQTIAWNRATNVRRVFLNMSDVANIATIRINGKEAGTLWTRPYRLDITGLLQDGDNRLEIEVANTWANRLIGDNLLPEDQRLTRTTAPFRLRNKPLLKAGLLGPVFLEIE